MRKLDKDEIQKELFDMLCLFADYCESEGLRYSLCGGTLLGAVRHKDFIPWDDDTDVIMPRADYIKFHKIAEESFLGNQYVLKSRILGNAVLPTARIVNLKTLTKSEYMSFENHLFLDIFPVDGLPSSRKEALPYLEKAYSIKKLMSLSQSKLGSGKTASKAVLKMPLAICSKFLGTRFFANRLVDMSLKYDFDDSEYVGAVASSCGKAELFEKSNFLEMKKYYFHGRYFSGIADHDAYLRRMYGEYMKLPPEKDRVYHYKTAYLFD